MACQATAKKSCGALALLMTLLTVTIFGYGQSLDSLYLAYKNAKSSERREKGAIIVQWLGERYELPENPLSDSKLSDDEFERALLNLTIRYLFRTEYYHLAYEAGQSLLKLSTLANDTTNLIISYYFMGFSCQRMGKMDDGLLYAKQCYDLCLAYQDDAMLSSVVNNIANIYQINYQDSLAVIYFQKSIDIERKLNRMQNLAIRLGNISTSYLRLGKLHEALSSATEGLNLDRKEGRPDRIAMRLHQVCEVYLEMGDFVKAKECELEALDYFTSANSQYGQSHVLQMLGNIERKLKRNDRAEKYYLQALSYAQEINNQLLIQRISNDLYLLYRDDDYEQSLLYFEQSVALRDSLFHKENQQQLNDFRIKYETSEKELKIVRQQAEISRQKSRKNMYRGGLTLSGLLLVALIYVVVLRVRRNRELVEINATKDKFFSIISHDLKNPAIAQRNALQLLIDNSENWDSSSLSDYYQKLLKSAEGQVGLLGNLLNWAQVQTGRMPYLPMEFELTEALRPDIELIVEMAGRKGITFETEMPDIAFVIGDEMMIATVVRNLLTNAIKFTSTQGEVSLSITPTTHSIPPTTHPIPPPSRYTISISDTGTGMSPEQMQRLFRIDQTHSLKGTAGEQGSGLGLIVCKELLQKHSSDLFVESEEGRGSRFWFTLGH